VESLKEMSLALRFEAVTSNTLSLMEIGPIMLSVAQKQAASGRDRERADEIRGQFPALASACIRPYLAPLTAATLDLKDEYAMQLPVALQTFLPDSQKARMVG